MLVYFKVGNYKSIKDPIVINFAATAINEHQDTNVFEKGKTKLLKTVLLYGANASGKSKILDAFVIYRALILDSAGYNSTRRVPVIPFDLNADTREQPSYFETEFILKNKRYRYGFEADEKSIRKEWLLEVKATTQTSIFLRIGQRFQVEYKKFLNAEHLETKCNENALFLSVADQWAVPLAKNIYSWFYDIYTIHGLMDDEYKEHTNELIKDPEYKVLINQMMQKADLGINSIEVIEITEEDKKRILMNTPDNLKESVGRVIDQDASPVLTKHYAYDELGNVIDEIAFDMAVHESEGTQKFYNIIGVILYAVKNGRVVVIDELDARLHTLLTKAIIRVFNANDIKTEAQLFAVAHDTAIMDRDLLRRDQIYIVEKDRFAATKIVNLVEYKVRKETPFDKNYLEGKYGGIPFIENFESLLKDGEKK
ncbi:ATP-binding protein [Chitinophaga agrisoli]|uniref:ATP-binding protein n=1 Tax=Chitinophaga agrisoli TaxID=2607653 RepID=A0A5B2VKK8_9BACT|nr:ATP-binding protein [Chitinophaga agrisoli]KAA2238832.1 ATP-binding protein [Chitinophaga agrisoli]